MHVAGRGGNEESEYTPVNNDVIPSAERLKHCAALPQEVLLRFQSASSSCLAVLTRRL